MLRRHPDRGATFLNRSFPGRIAIQLHIQRSLSRTRTVALGIPRGQFEGLSFESSEHNFGAQSGHCCKTYYGSSRADPSEFDSQIQLDWAESRARARRPSASARPVCASACGARRLRLAAGRASSRSCYEQRLALGCDRHDGHCVVHLACGFLASISIGLSPPATTLGAGKRCCTRCGLV